MAYITTDQVKEKRIALKKEFPSSEGWKFSITNEHHSVLSVSIMESPIDFKSYGLDKKSVNQYYIKEHYKETPEIAEVLQKITDICMEGNHDNSDAMTDYFDVGWYFELSIGKWDKSVILNKK